MFFCHPHMVIFDVILGMVYTWVRHMTVLFPLPPREDQDVARELAPGVLRKSKAAIDPWLYRRKIHGCILENETNDDQPSEKLTIFSQLWPTRMMTPPFLRFNNKSGIFPVRSWFGIILHGIQKSCFSPGEVCHPQSLHPGAFSKRDPRRSMGCFNGKVWISLG